jgi:hypothetical protein
MAILAGILGGGLYFLFARARRAFGTTRVTAALGTLAVFAFLAWEWAFLLKRQL